MNMVMNEDRVSQAADEPVPDVYLPRRDTASYCVTPRTIYFYYLHRDQKEPSYDQEEPPCDQEKEFQIKHYVHIARGEITKSEMGELIKQLVENARARHPSDPKWPQYGASWEHIVWMRKSYFVVFIDDPAVVPKAGRALSVDPPGSNLSFFDAWEEPVELVDLEGRPATYQAICCINHMKGDAQGTDLGPEQQKVDFNLHTNPPLSSEKFYPGTGGTNMGPPVHPMVETRNEAGASK